MSQILFGDFVLDVSARTLRHHYALVALRPKEFDLLLLFATSRGAAVSKDAIVDMVWRSEVSDAALVQCVYRLRQTLAKHEPQTNHIVTIPRCGYRFGPLTLAVA